MIDDCPQPLEAAELEDVPPPTLELLERQTTALLYAVWKARGVKKRIVRVESAGNCETMEVVKDEINNR